MNTLFFKLWDRQFRDINHILLDTVDRSTWANIWVGVGHLTWKILDEELR